MNLHKTILISQKSLTLSIQTTRTLFSKDFLSFMSRPTKRNKDTPNPERELKKWRPEPLSSLETNSSIFSLFDFKHLRKENPAFIGRGSMPKASDVSHWWTNKLKDYLDHDQRFIPERHQTLGNDLAVAHFVIARKGKIRQMGSDYFIAEEDVLEHLPGKYVQDWYVEEVNMSDIEISYKGLHNFRGLEYLKRISFKNCTYFNDWCLDRIIALCPSIEYLDVSDNKDISERGLECLYKAWNLKEFVVTDYHKNPSFELTCLMVEDCMPGLTIRRQIPSTNADDDDDETEKKNFNMLSTKFIMKP